MDLSCFDDVFEEQHFQRIRDQKYRNMENQRQRIESLNIGIRERMAYSYFFEAERLGLVEPLSDETKEKWIRDFSLAHSPHRVSTEETKREVDAAYAKNPRNPPTWIKRYKEEKHSKKED